MSAISLGVLAVCVLANVAAVASLVLARRSPRPFAFAVGSLLAGAAVLALGLVGTVYGLKVAFGAIAGAAPEYKAQLLARGISEAMSSTAFGLVASILPFAISLVLLFRRRRPDTRPTST